MFLSEMDRPGIEVRPLYFMNRAHVYNEVFFDNLRVPKKNIVGQLNQGWYVTMATANFERSQGTASGVMRDIQDIIAYCKKTMRNHCCMPARSGRPDTVLPGDATQWTTSGQEPFGPL